VIVAELLAWSATLLAVAGALPQVRRLAQRRDRAGVSVVGPMVGVASETTWIAYTLDAGLWAAAVEPVLMIAANAALVLTVLRAGGRVRWASVAALAWVAGVTAVGCTGGWPAIGTTLGLAYAVQAGPCVWSVYRVAVPTGVAARTWIANLGEAVLWTAYGAAKRDHALMVLGIVEFAAAVAILLRIALRAPTEARATPPDRVGHPARPGARRSGWACR
jgi:hypothetical protein